MSAMAGLIAGALAGILALISTNTNPALAFITVSLIGFTGLYTLKD